ncbi:sugar transferase [Polynucleobacter necessarius]|uniref:sugar transferase n=1 Tax=Polynucleobacter necessarius TaxID=576610 RepID=UPI0013B0570C|nr:sugar transferase [Polynucleobacter necessarius]
MIRLFDISLAIFFSPLYLLLLIIGSVLKLIIDGRPIFYISKRCVKNLKEVKVYKFRTMINERLLIENEVAKYTKNGFETIPLRSNIYTPLGRIYEKFQLVELPQFLNILIGEISFVGYRPLPEKNIKKLTNDLGGDLVTQRHKYNAGLTGYTQLIGKINLSPTKRLQLEIQLGQDLYENGLIMASKTYFSLILDTIILIVFDKTIFINREKLIE